MGLIFVTSAVEPPKCRPSIKFYHLAHGAISSRRDNAVLDGFYKAAYVVRQSIQSVGQRPASALTSGTTTLYVIQSECHRAPSKIGIGISVTIIDAVRKSNQTISYPMGFNDKPITFISSLGQKFLIECVDTYLFAFDMLLANSNEIVARVRNIRITKKLQTSIDDIFTLEINDRYNDYKALFISVALAVDEYLYLGGVAQKRKPCM